MKKPDLPGCDPSLFASVSVIVPVYECAERLPRHLEALQTLSGRIREIIWVITKSPDDSDQMAREAAARLGGRILEVPRGLYSAWNAGIAAAKGEIIYISTVGDVISTDGLVALIGLLKKTGADVAISPPAIYPPSKANLKRSRHWPLFYFEKLLQSYAGKVIPRRQAILMQLLSGASGLTGSCASCLFRAPVLKNRPFPVDHHHYGDTAWLFYHLPEVSLAYWAEPVARFEIHDSEFSRIVDKNKIYSLMRLLAEHLPAEEFLLVEKMTQALIQLDLLREPHPRYGWWFHHKAWHYRFIREKCKRLLKCSLISAGERHAV